MNKIFGIDPGTANFQSAQSKDDGSIEYKKIRNCFITLDATPETEEALTSNDWMYIKDEKENKYYILGDDAIKTSRMFNIQMQRPMKDGCLNSNEPKNQLIISEIIEKMIDKADPEGVNMISTCVSAQNLDKNIDSTYHKMRLQSLMSRLNYQVNVIEEGLAIILSENPVMEDPETGVLNSYSGISVSLGGGMANVCLAFKGKTIDSFSINRGGDYIDEQVSKATGVSIPKVISIKEKLLDLDNIDYNNDVLFALDAYYSELIKYIFNHFNNRFKSVKSEFPGPLEVILAGGGCCKGFANKVEKVIKEMSLPFEIKSVREAKDVANSVCKGLLIHATVAAKKKIKEQEELKKKQEAEIIQQKAKPKKEKSAAQAAEDLNDIL